LTVHCLYKLIIATSPLILFGPRSRMISGLALDDNRELHLTMLGATSFSWAFREFWHPDITRRSPLYDRITHIRVETVNSFKTRHKLHNFRRLSHLSVPYYNSSQHEAKHLDDFLELRSLEMFVVAGVRKPLQQAHWERLQEWVRVKRQTDKRVFLVEVPAMDIQAEWEMEMRGGESIWDRAFRYTAKWEAVEMEKAALELQAANSRSIMPRRARRNISGIK